MAENETKAILDGIEAIGKKVDAQKEASDKTLTEYKSQLDKSMAEVEKLRTEFETKMTNELKNLTEDLTKKGKTLEEILVAQNELKARAGRMGEGGYGGQLIKTASAAIADIMRENFDEIKALAGKSKKAGGYETKGQIGPMITDYEYKATGGNMTTSADLTGNAVAQYMLTPAVRGRRKVQIRDLVQIVNSATGTWKFYRQNLNVSVGSFGFQGGQGLTKQQIEYLLTEVTTTTDYLAGFVRFAKQMAQDLPFLQTFVANELIEDYKRTESSNFIPTLLSNAAAVPITSGSNLAEKIIDNISVLLATDYDPNTILTNATQWAALLKTKPNDYSIPGGVTIDEQGNIRVVGIPVMVSNNMPSGSGNGTTLIGDFSKAAIIQTEGLSVNFYEQDSDNVQKNLITARCEARVALAMLRLDAFVFF